MLVNALAGHRWQRVRSEVVNLWLEVLPEQADAVGWELARVRDDALSARAVGDTATEQALATVWQSRLQNLVQVNPQTGQRLLALLAAPSTMTVQSVEAPIEVGTHKSTQNSVAQDSSTVYSAQRDVDVRHAAETQGFVYATGDNTVVGQVADSSITDNRSKYRVRIGRLNLGVGGFVAIIVALVFGTTVSVTLVTQGSDGVMSSVAGTWQRQATDKSNGKFVQDGPRVTYVYGRTATVQLVIDSDGTWVSTGSVRDPSGTYPDSNLECEGTVSVRGNVFEFTPSSSENKFTDPVSRVLRCDPFTAMLTGDGRTLTRYSETGSFDLIRIGT